MVIHEMIISILYVSRTAIMFSTMGCTILMHWILKKPFFSTIFHIINVHLWNKTSLDTHYNIHYFCYRHYNNVLHVGIHDIDALDLQEKLSFPPFYIISMFIYEMSQTWILVTISILLLWAPQSSSPHWDTRYRYFGFERKGFLSTIFLVINVHPWNKRNLDTYYNLHSFH